MDNTHPCCSPLSCPSSWNSKAFSNGDSGGAFYVVWKREGGDGRGTGGGFTRAWLAVVVSGCPGQVIEGVCSTRPAQDGGENGVKLPYLLCYFLLFSLIYLFPQIMCKSHFVVTQYKQCLLEQVLLYFCMMYITEVCFCNYVLKIFSYHSFSKNQRYFLKTYSLSFSSFQKGKKITCIFEKKISN